jgi:hypothetical protein
MERVADPIDEPGHGQLPVADLAASIGCGYGDDWAEPPDQPSLHLGGQGGTGGYVLTCWPPGPPAVEKRHVSSARGISTPGATRTTSPGKAHLLLVAIANC